MPTLQKTIGSPGAWLRPFLVGKGADMPAVRQDLAAQHYVASVTDRNRCNCRGDFIGGIATLAPWDGWHYFGAGVVAAAVCIHLLARNVCVAGEFSVEMRIA